MDLDNWENSLPKIDPYYDGLSVLGKYKHGGLEMTLARKRTKRLVTFGKRDFTFLSVSEHLKNDQVRISGTVSVSSPRMSKERGYVRAYQDSMSYYESMDNDADTGRPRMRLTMVFRLDLNDSTEGGDGANVPMWVYVKTAGTSAMASVQNMKRLLEAQLIEKERVWSGDEKSCEKSWLKRVKNGTKKC